MAYKGDSPGKKLARAMFWSAMASRDLVGDEQRVLVLGGPDAGDLRSLAGIGHASDRVVAVEMEDMALKHYLESALPYAKTVQVHQPESITSVADLDRLIAVDRAEGRTAAGVFSGDVRHISQVLEGLNASVVFLDFCSPLMERLAQLSVLVAERCLSRGGVLGIGVMYGREPEHKALRELLHVRRELGKLVGVRDKGKLRLALADHLVRKSAQRRGATVRFDGWLRYVSRTSDSVGVPMIYAWWTWGANGYGRDAMRPLLDLSGADAASLAGRVRNCALWFYRLGIELGMSDKVSTAAAASRLCLDMDSVIAWRAHGVRGTYGQAVQMLLLKGTRAAEKYRLELLC